MSTFSQAVELCSSLRVAARAAQQYGATEDQINSIVALARGSNQYNIMSDGRLTRVDADRIINAMMDAGAEPEFRKSDDELAAEQDLADSAIQAALRRKAGKASAKQHKKEREDLMALRTAAAVAANTRRISHSKFGTGTVIKEDQLAIVVQFDSQKKPMRIASGFYKEV